MDDQPISLFSLPESGLLVVGDYSPSLVLLSILIAILSSFVALHAISYASVFTSRWGRQTAIFVGGLAMGIGVWSMHFLGMLAFDLCTVVSYDSFITLLSIVPSVGASWIALNFISTHQTSKKSLLICGMLVGAGIGAMHYLGMAAMEMAPLLRYDISTFIISIAVAVALAVLSLWIRFYLGSKLVKTHTLVINFLASIVMGGAISGMHYTGMAAARFVLPPGMELEEPGANMSQLLAYGVAGATVVIAFIVFAITLITKYKLLSLEYQSSEEKMRTIMNSAVDSIITINNKGIVVSVNHATTSLLGWYADDLVGFNVNKIVPTPYHHQHDNFIKQYLLTKKPKVIGSGRDVEALHKDGSRIAVRLSIGHAALPGQDYFVAFLSDLRQRVKMEDSLKLKEKKFRTLVTNIPGVAYRRANDESWTMHYVSAAIRTLTGIPAHYFMNAQQSTAFLSLILKEDREKVKAAIDTCRVEQTLEYRIKDSRGNIRWITDSFRVCEDENGQQYVDGFMMDSTRRVEDTTMIKRYKSLVESSEDAIVSLSPCGVVLTCNDAACRLYGFTSGEIVGQPASRVLGEIESQDALIEKVAKGQVIRHFRTTVKPHNGRLTHVSVSVSPVFDASQQIIGISMISRNINHEVEQEAMIRQQAIEDPLTHLFNRAGIQEKVSEVLSVSRRTKQPFYLFFLDLDNFKFYNDSYGHDVGDMLLNAVASILTKHLKRNDIAGRLGGDEFVVCLRDCKTTGKVSETANAIIEDITRISHINGAAVSLSASMGVAGFPKDGESLTELFKAADDAMYLAKGAGKNQVYFPGVASKRSVYMLSPAELTNAIANDELELFFQPIMSIHSGTILKAEALVRWNHPRLGRLSPDHFIPLAEKNGIIGRLGNWVERQALCQLERWTTLFGEDFQLAINKSALELIDPEYGACQLEQQLLCRKLSGKNLVIEITEHSMLEYSEATQNELGKYRALGVQIALDDFGTGYSSLMHLKHYPVDYLKIDRSFVSSLNQSNIDYRLCKGTTHLAKLLNVQVVAEGVETQAQHDLLKPLGCDFIQGYFISKPVSAIEFEHMAYRHNHTRIKPDLTAPLF
ncbi:bifunctional diguanylate cyclase/phosphodiesterase [Salinimonas iocasae]|uniref:Sensor protein FixL n=1 Tax=Salinimonas iocasae TaxID=2572577 RepID=A0A5B7YG52_9ALTE|nr:EAL domain-containing protein [Salinimonas iocasae]QCZ94631.1 EAL domain-containing protein [Salinimonas iocasae]